MQVLGAFCGYSIDWGDVPTWLAGATSVGLLAFGVREYSRSVKNDQLRQLADERRQASRVYPVAESFEYPGRDKPSTATVYVTNSSDLPIYKCSLRLLAWDWKSSNVEKRFLGKFETLLPGDSSRQEITDADGLEHPLRSMSPGKLELHPPLQIEFTDAAGIEWIRRPDGELLKATNS